MGSEVHTIYGCDLGTQVWLSRPGEPGPDINRFRAPQGCRLMCKPEKGGFWTSTESARISGWAQWCDGEQFSTGPHERWLLVPDPMATLIEVDSYEDLELVHDAYGFEAGVFFDRKIDFPRMAQDYAGMHLTERGQWATRHSRPYNLYGWDCESTLWFQWRFIKVEFGGTVEIPERSYDG